MVALDQLFSQVFTWPEEPKSERRKREDALRDQIVPPEQIEKWKETGIGVRRRFLYSRGRAFFTLEIKTGSRTRLIDVSLLKNGSASMIEVTGNTNGHLNGATPATPEGLIDFFGQEIEAEIAREA